VHHANAWSPLRGTGTSILLIASKLGVSALSRIREQVLDSARSSTTSVQILVHTWRAQITVRSAAGVVEHTDRLCGSNGENHRVRRAFRSPLHGRQPDVPAPSTKCKRAAVGAAERLLLFRTRGLGSAGVCAASAAIAWQTPSAPWLAPSAPPHRSTRCGGSGCAVPPGGSRRARSCTHDGVSMVRSWFSCIALYTLMYICKSASLTAGVSLSSTSSACGRTPHEKPEGPQCMRSNTNRSRLVMRTMTESRSTCGRAQCVRRNAMS